MSWKTKGVERIERMKLYQVLKSEHEQLKGETEALRQSVALHTTPPPADLDQVQSMARQLEAQAATIRMLTELIANLAASGTRTKVG